MSQNFIVLCEYAVNDTVVGPTSNVCIPLLWYY